MAACPRRVASGRPSRHARPGSTPPPPRARAALCPGVVARPGLTGHGAPARPLLRPWCGSASPAPARSPCSDPRRATLRGAVAWRGAPPARSPPARGHGVRPTPLPAPAPAAPLPATIPPWRPTQPRPARGPSGPPASACPVPPTSACPACAVSAPACLWRAALSSASAWPRAFGPDMALLPLAARSATRAQLGPDVCAARSRHVSAALRARLLTWCALCFGTARLALGALV
jgi:hypothetical protein